MNIRNKEIFSLIKTKQADFYLNNPDKKINYKICLKFLDKIEKKTGKKYKLEDIFNPIYVRNLPKEIIFEYGNDKESVWRLIEDIMRKIEAFTTSIKQNIQEKEENVKIKIITFSNTFILIALLLVYYKINH